MTTEGTSTTTSVNCLVCDSAIELAAGSLPSELVTCPSCGQEHEILEAGDQPSLALAPEVEEDWGE